MQKLFFPIFLIVLLGFTTNLQAQNSRLKYADKLYQTQSYFYASEAYEDVLDRKVDSMIVADKIADCYDKIGNVPKAVEWYSYIASKGALKKEQHLRLAVLNRGIQDYEASNNLFREYTNKYGVDDQLTKLYSGRSIDELLKNSGQFELISQNRNTENSEIGANYLSADEIILASSKRRSKAVMRLHSWTGNYFYDIYKAPIDENGVFGKMKLLKADAKTKFHDGPASYCQKSGFVYFTRNNFVDGKKIADSNNVIHLKIFKARIEGKKFVDVEELSINSNDFSTAHPSVNTDGSRLYFSSNRPGGFGGMDLYYVELDGNGLPIGEVVNLGEKVNTIQNEVFPFFQSSENLLFFSSDGHFGLGGLDVFVAKLNKQGAVKGEIQNLGVPINSASDDFSFLTNEDQTKGYFSSNRSGGKGDDDIYGFKQNFIIKNSAIAKGKVIDLISKRPLPNTSMYLVDLNNQIVDSVKTNDLGDYEFDLAAIENNFSITASKEKYHPDTLGMLFDQDRGEYEANFELMPLLNYKIKGLTRDKSTSNPIDNVVVTITDVKLNQQFEKPLTDKDGKFSTSNLPYKYGDEVEYIVKLEHPNYNTKLVTVKDKLGLVEDLVVEEMLESGKIEFVPGETDLSIFINPIYFDFDKSNIRPDAAEELDKIVRIMKDYPRMVIELGSHTDSRGSDAYNRVLSDKRAKSSANYIISKGISKDRIYGKGYGESKLIYSDAEIANAPDEKAKEEMHQKNRRTEFIIVRMK